jgi:hypothetical protein
MMLVIRNVAELSSALASRSSEGQRWPAVEAGIGVVAGTTR